jgi:hypothetical protein
MRLNCATGTQPEMIADSMPSTMAQPSCSIPSRQVNLPLKNGALSAVSARLSPDFLSRNQMHDIVALFWCINAKTLFFALIWCKLAAMA